MPQEQADMAPPPKKRRKLGSGRSVNSNSNCNNCSYSSEDNELELEDVNITNKERKMNEIKCQLGKMQMDIFGKNSNAKDWIIIIDAISKIALNSKWSDESDKNLAKDRTHIPMRINDCRKNIKEQTLTRDDERHKNITFECHRVNGMPKIYMFTSKLIKANEQLLGDYGNCYYESMENVEKMKERRANSVEVYKNVLKGALKIDNVDVSLRNLVKNRYDLTACDSD